MNDKGYSDMTRKNMERPFKPLNKKEPGFWTWVKDLWTVKTSCECARCQWANSEEKKR